jgi:hypothetical protein
MATNAEPHTATVASPATRAATSAERVATRGGALSLDPPLADTPLSRRPAGRALDARAGRAAPPVAA